VPAHPEFDRPMNRACLIQIKPEGYKLLYPSSWGKSTGLPVPATCHGESAFTLIELLIVVAIIAILAAIAAPNFLEAQTRSKVSRAHSDLRSIAVALEAYRVEHNQYPNEGIPLSDPLEPVSLLRLSTPVSYITDPYLDDPFRRDLPEDAGRDHRSYLYAYMLPFYNGDYSIENLDISFFGIRAFPLGWGINIRNDQFPLPCRWALLSFGPDNHPDLVMDRLIGVFPILGETFFPAHYMPYDPTNGTVSLGDVFRFGP
jgi:type II secretion system protein G